MPYKYTKGEYPQQETYNKPFRNKGVIHIYVETEIKNELSGIAESKGMTMSKLSGKLIKGYIKRERERQANDTNK